MPRLGAERLFNPMLKGAMATDAGSDDYQWAGRTTLGSGSATVTISTAAVNSDSIIVFGSQAHTDAGANKGMIDVKTISPGNHFIIGTSDGSTLARDTTVMWLLLLTSDPD